MFTRFTDRTNKILAYANVEAQRLNHTKLSSAHILLGLIKEGAGIGAQLLRNLGLDLEQARAETEKLLANPQAIAQESSSPFDWAKYVIENAVTEAQRFHHDYLGSEHLMMALVMDEGIAGRVLSQLGITRAAARQELDAMYGAKPVLESPSGTAFDPECVICNTVREIRLDPSFISELQATCAVLGGNQGTPGWCVLFLKEHHEHLAALPFVHQLRIFEDVARTAAAIRSVFPTSGKDGLPPRINYECLGNLVPHIHWHIILRHADDPEPTKAVWGWPEQQLKGDMTQEERTALITKLRAAIQ